MPSFRYKAYGSSGGTTSGIIDAESEKHALGLLKSQGLLIRSIQGAEGPARRSFSFAGRSVSVSDRAIFTRRLATLVASHVPIYDAVSMLFEQEQNSSLKAVLGTVRERIAEGASLSRAMADHGTVFPESFVNMVAAGEAGGALPTVLEHLADYMEEQEQARSRIVSALAYPVLMVVVGVSVMLFLVGVVIPRIVLIFESTKSSLPLITRILIGMSHLIRSWWWVLPLAFILFLTLYRKLAEKDSFRLWRDTVILRIPLAGQLLQQLLLARFSRMLGLLLKSGVPIIRSIEIASASLANTAYAVFLNNVRENVAQGRPLAASLSESSLFPPLLVHMTGVGEKGGTLDEMLLKAGLSYEREFSARLGRFVALLEPLLVLSMGVAVGIVVMAVLLPIFELNQLIR